jgi:predicted transglutaminase-like cysteine proteinase
MSEQGISENIDRLSGDGGDRRTGSAIARRAAIAAVLSLSLCAFTQPSYAGSDDENVLPPLGHTQFCARYPRDCDRTSSRNITSIPFGERWPQLNFINEVINAVIAPKPGDPTIDSDWLIGPAEGNCNDYAVTKRHLLLEAGWPASALLLAEVVRVTTGEHHLILVVRGTNSDFVLDNLRPFIVSLAETRDDYLWVRVQSAQDPRFWTVSFSGLR